MKKKQEQYKSVKESIKTHEEARKMGWKAELRKQEATKKERERESKLKEIAERRRTEKKAQLRLSIDPRLKRGPPQATSEDRKRLNNASLQENKALGRLADTIEVQRSTI